MTERSKMLKITPDQLFNFLHCNPNRINSLLGCYHLAYIPSINTVCDQSSIHAISPANVVTKAEYFNKDHLKNGDSFIPTSSSATTPSSIEANSDKETTSSSHNNIITIYDDKPNHWIESLSWDELSEMFVDETKLKYCIQKGQKFIRFGKHAPFERIHRRVQYVHINNGEL